MPLNESIRPSNVIYGFRLFIRCFRLNVKRLQKQKKYLLMSLALRWYGSMASKCDSFIFSSLATPNVNKSCLHFVIDGSPFDLQYLLTSFANIEYKCDIYVYKIERKPQRKRRKVQKRENRLVNSCGLFCMNIQYYIYIYYFMQSFSFCSSLEWNCIGLFVPV